MFGLTNIGIVHTAISLVAVAAAVVSLVRYKEIAPRTTTGSVYVWTTVATCLTGFFIFQHGGFGKPHALGVLTLIFLAVASAATYGGLFGRASIYVSTICYSTTVFFHLVPAATESFTRLPAGSPVFSSPDDPDLQKIIGFFAVVLIVGLVFQVVRIRGIRKALSVATVATVATPV